MKWLSLHKTPSWPRNAQLTATALCMSDTATQEGAVTVLQSTKKYPRLNPGAPHSTRPRPASPAPWTPHLTHQ